MALRRITIRAFTARRKNSPKPVSEDRSERQDRGDRPYRNERFNRPSRPRQDGRSADGEDGREDRRPRMNGGDDSLPLDVLPPAIGREPPEQEAEDVRRSATPAAPPRSPPRATDGDDEIAPAA